MLCEEIMIITQARNAFSLTQSIKQITPPKTQSNTNKINKHKINCGMTNHNVETCKKKYYTIIVTIEATQLNQRSQNKSSYACHICGLNGHKMTNYPKFIEMQKMFHGKSIIVVEVQPIVEIQKITIDLNVVDVNVITTSSKSTKE